MQQGIKLSVFVTDSPVEYLIRRFPAGTQAGNDAINEAFLNSLAVDRWMLIERAGRRGLFVRQKQG